MLWADGICLHIFTLFLPSRTAANKPDGAIASLLLLRRRLPGTKAPTPATASAGLLPPPTPLYPNLLVPQNCAASQARASAAAPLPLPPARPSSPDPRGRAATQAWVWRWHARARPLACWVNKSAAPPSPLDTTKVLTFLP